MVAPSADSAPIGTSPEVTLSVIVPVLNEVDRIGPCLAPLSGPGVEIIIVDGGSNDAGLENLPVQVSKVLHCPRGRARQMNAGAAVAEGQLLVFVHADTLLGVAAWQRLQSLAACRNRVWGRFNVCLSGPGWIYRLIGACMNLRSRVTGICTGDQVLFVSNELFKSCGGYPEIALMEDIAISSLLGAVQAPLCCREQVRTSTRRWRSHGVLNTLLLMWRLRLAYFFGADPDSLASLYYRGSRS